LFLVVVLSVVTLAVNVDIGNRWHSSQLLSSNGFVIYNGIVMDTRLELNHCPAVDDRVREVFGDGATKRNSDLYQMAYGHWRLGEDMSDAAIEESAGQVRNQAESLMEAAIESGCETYRGWPGGGGSEFLRALLFQAIVSTKRG